MWTAELASGARGRYTDSELATLFEKIGSEQLRAVIEDFYDRVFDDAMIGFLFAGKDRQRLADKEWELVARLLGADVAYSGRSMRRAHAAVPILGGHFERRLQILRETLADHDVAPEVREAWIDHSLALRHVVTGDRGSECDHEVAASRLRNAPESSPASNDLIGLTKKRPRNHD